MCCCSLSGMGGSARLIATSLYRTGVAQVATPVAELLSLTRGGADLCGPRLVRQNQRRRAGVGVEQARVLETDIAQPRPDLAEGVRVAHLRVDEHVDREDQRVGG